jgi:glycosyltransferase involved in cell wall biosynthesis
LTTVALVHDYLTQRGGAERVVLSMLKAFPTAPLHTSLYLPDATFPEFRRADIRLLQLNRVSAFRRHHRLALPFLAPAFATHGVTAEVVICSSSGWAHGARVNGRKIVYCHVPARWLYQTEGVLARDHPLAGVALLVMAQHLRRWDLRAARSAHRYLAPSTAIRDQIRLLYGVDAEVLPAPNTMAAEHARKPIEGLTQGFFLCVARLVPHKNVDTVMAAFSDLPQYHLVVAGTGPEASRLKRIAPPNVKLVGMAADDQLAWLYANCDGVIAAGHESFGLTPLEAAVFGKPSVVLRSGGFLDTVIEGGTGVFFDSPTPLQIRQAVKRVNGQRFNADAIRDHASRYSEEQFVKRLRDIVLDEAGAA